MNSTRFRIRFRKAGDLRFLSHHDLMRLFERMLRRAQLAFAVTEGFHPKPKMTFANALALGIVGLQEAVEIEFSAPVTPEEVRCKLTGESPADLEILEVVPVDRKTAQQACRAGYRLELHPNDSPEDLAHRIKAVMEQSESWVERLKPKRRRLDIRPYLIRMEVVDRHLVMEIAVTPHGTARPDEVLGLLGLGERLLAGAILERYLLEIQEETAAPAGSGPG